MSALKRLHHDEDLITEEECRRFGKLSRRRHLHAFSLTVDTCKDEVLRMTDLIDYRGYCRIAQKMRGMCSVQVAIFNLVSNPEHQFYIFACLTMLHIKYNVLTQILMYLHTSGGVQTLW